jgi:osmoprotectant transport system ATP-binding protein
MPSAIALRNVTVRRGGGVPILDSVDLEIASGQTVAIIGRSGAGKTTALRLVNGLAVPTTGDVLIDEQPLSQLDLVATRRRIGYVIQGSGLLPHRTVFDNIATVPRLLGWPEERIRERARALLKQLSLTWERYGQRFPRTLSGGEQQRVAIARAMAAEPGILLCDEPFGALDPIVRRELQEAFCALRDAGSTTIVFVTHDLREALRIGRRLVMFEEGRIVADAPAGEFVTLSDAVARRFVKAAELAS